MCTRHKFRVAAKKQTINGGKGTAQQLSPITYGSATAWLLLRLSLTPSSLGDRQCQWLSFPRQALVILWQLMTKSKPTLFPCLQAELDLLGLTSVTALDNHVNDFTAGAAAAAGAAGAGTGAGAGAAGARVAGIPGIPPIPPMPAGWGAGPAAAAAGMAAAAGASPGAAGGVGGVQWAAWMLGQPARGGSQQVAPSAPSPPSKRPGHAVHALLHGALWRKKKNPPRLRCSPPCPCTTQPLYSHGTHLKLTHAALPPAPPPDIARRGSGGARMDPLRRTRSSQRREAEASAAAAAVGAGLGGDHLLHTGFPGFPASGNLAAPAAAVVGAAPAPVAAGGGGESHSWLSSSLSLASMAV